jgi:hypothetical protein
VAVQIGRDPKTVKRYALDPKNANKIEAMKEELADMFEGLARRMVSSITEEDITKLDGYRRTISAGIATDKMRLLREQSTANLNNMSLVAVVKRIDDRCREEYRKRARQEIESDKPGTGEPCA